MVQSLLNFQTVKDVYRLAENSTRTMGFRNFGRQFWVKSNFNYSSCGPHIFSNCRLQYSECVSCLSPIKSWNIQDIPHIHYTFCIIVVIVIIQQFNTYITKPSFWILFIVSIFFQTYNLPKIRMEGIFRYSWSFNKRRFEKSRLLFATTQRNSIFRSRWSLTESGCNYCYK